MEGLVGHVLLDLLHLRAPKSCVSEQITEVDGLRMLPRRLIRGEREVSQRKVDDEMKQAKEV
jgi:hypothetical protein